MHGYEASQVTCDVAVHTVVSCDGQKLGYLAGLHQVGQAGRLPAGVRPQHRVQRAQQRADVVLLALGPGVQLGLDLIPQVNLLQLSASDT